MVKIRTKKLKSKSKNKHKKILKGGSCNIAIPNVNNKKNTSKQCENHPLYFNNIKGTCWMLSIFMILLTNNSEALTELNKFDIQYFNTKLDKTLHEKLNNTLDTTLDNSVYNYLHKLPNNFFIDETKTTITDKHKSLIINFFLELKQRLCNKIKQSQKSHRRERLKSINSSSISIKPTTNKNNKLTQKLQQLNSSNSCEYKLDKYFRLLFGPEHECNINGVCSGGIHNDKINLLLLISIFLCNSYFLIQSIDEYLDQYLVQYHKQSEQKQTHEHKNDIDLIKGIYISIQSHGMSFYKCYISNELMFCSNDFIVKYDWSILLDYLKSKDYQIYYNKLYEMDYYNNHYYEDYKIDDLYTKQLFVIVKYNFKYNQDKNQMVYEINNNKLKLIFEVDDITTLYDDNNNFLQFTPVNDLIFVKQNLLNKDLPIIEQIIYYIKNNNEKNALHLLQENKNKDNLNGNTIDETNGAGRSLLMLSIIHKCPNIALYFLKQTNCNVNIVDNTDSTAFDYSISNVDFDYITLEIINNIKPKWDFTITNTYDATPLEVFINKYSIYPIIQFQTILVGICVIMYDNITNENKLRCLKSLEYAKKTIQSAKTNSNTNTKIKTIITFLDDTIELIKKNKN